MKAVVSQICTLPTSFARDVEEYAASGIEFLEVWFTKLEQHLEAHTLPDVRSGWTDIGCGCPWPACRVAC